MLPYPDKEQIDSAFIASTELCVLLWENVMTEYSYAMSPIISSGTFAQTSMLSGDTIANHNCSSIGNITHAAISVAWKAEQEPHGWF